MRTEYSAIISYYYYSRVSQRNEKASKQQMEDQLLSMEESSTSLTCTGWRESPVESWLNALSTHRIYELGTGGVLLGKDYFLAKLQHVLPRHISYEKYLQLNPGDAAICEAAATALNTKHGGLYEGMRDCIRSVMCIRNGGCASLGGACHACHALNHNQAFRKRLGRIETGSTSGGAPTIRDSYLTRAELASKSDTGYVQRHVEQTAERRKDLLAEWRTEQIQKRGAAAVQQVSELLKEFCSLAERADEAERQATVANIDVAITAQRTAKAEEQAGQKTEIAEEATASLQAMAVASALVSERCEEERRERMLAEADALNAHHAKRQALSATAEARCEAEKARNYAAETLARYHTPTYPCSSQPSQAHPVPTQSQCMMGWGGMASLSHPYPYPPSMLIPAQPSY